MKKIRSKKTTLFIALLSLIFFPGCKKDNENKNDDTIIVITATGDINLRLNEFRELLGEQLNTTPDAVGGRREINWDGIPEDMLSRKLSDDFLNPTGPGASAKNQRGLVYASVGNFQVSKSNFEEINAAASGEFSSFSGNKVFANISSSLWEVGFQLPGKAVAAKVKGFGIVFSDVDLPQSTSIEFFNGVKSLGKFFVPAKSIGNFSFLGVYFKTERVSHVSVAHDGHLDQAQNDVSNNGPHDLVVMDDFLYSEPVNE